jgi:hypothetical protein
LAPPPRRVSTPLPGRLPRLGPGGGVLHRLHVGPPQFVFDSAAPMPANENGAVLALQGSPGSPSGVNPGHVVTVPSPIRAADRGTASGEVAHNLLKIMAKPRLRQKSIEAARAPARTRRTPQDPLRRRRG